MNWSEGHRRTTLSASRAYQRCGITALPVSRGISFGKGVAQESAAVTKLFKSKGALEVPLPYRYTR